MRTRNKLATLLAGATLASTTLLAGAAPASAAGPCGDSYTLVGAYDIGTSVVGYRTGTLEVYYSSSTGKNCALTYGYGDYANTTSYKRVIISRGDGSGRSTDEGQYKYYAGPVYVSAPGQCIDVIGSVPLYTNRHLDNVHCG